MNILLSPNTQPLSTPLNQTMSLARLVTMRRNIYGDVDEMYSMYDPKTFFTGNHLSEESESDSVERTIIVKRTDLLFNN